MSSQEFDSFNLALKVAILANGLTQRQLAKRVHIDETRLSRIVRGQVAAFPSERRVLAKVLKRTEVELFPPRVEAVA